MIQYTVLKTVLNLTSSSRYFFAELRRVQMSEKERERARARAREREREREGGAKVSGQCRFLRGQRGHNTSGIVTLGL